MANPKVVIDTNILIGGAYDENSASWKIIKGVIEGRIEAYATHNTMKENRLLLNQAVMDREYKELLEGYFRRLKIVKVHNAPFTPSYIKRGLGELLKDEEDYKLFESALAAEARYLITNDRDVLYVEEFEGVKVVTPEDFWGKYKEDDDSTWQDWTKMLMGK